MLFANFHNKKIIKQHISFPTLEEIDTNITYEVKRFSNLKEKIKYYLFGQRINLKKDGFKFYILK